MDGNCVTCPKHGWHTDHTCPKCLEECPPVEVRSVNGWMNEKARTADTGDIVAGVITSKNCLIAMTAINEFVRSADSNRYGIEYFQGLLRAAELVKEALDKEAERYVESD